MKSWHYSVGAGVIIYVSALIEVNTKTDWLSLLFPGTQMKSFDIGSINDNYVNSLLHLTESEWAITWLVICGFSLGKIATLIDMKSQSVDLKISHAYLKLGVSNREELFKMALRNR